MNRAQLISEIEKFVEGWCIETIRVKGADYETGDDAFAGLKANAAANSLRPERVLMVLMTKHMDAIRTWIERGVLHSEPIQERIADAVNHLFLLYGFLVSEGLVKTAAPSPAAEALSDIECLLDNDAVSDGSKALLRGIAIPIRTAALTDEVEK